MIACVANALNRVGYLCVLGFQCHRYVSIAGLISSCTSSTLVAYPASRVLTLGSLGVSGQDDDESVEFVMIALLKISESSLNAVMVLSLKGAYGRSACGCCNASVSTNADLVAISADDRIDILSFFRNNLTVSLGI